MGSTEYKNAKNGTWARRPSRGQIFCSFKVQINRTLQRVPALLNMHKVSVNGKASSTRVPCQQQSNNAAHAHGTAMDEAFNAGERKGGPMAID
uniref:Uncharacterized protein n=1 Tax=Globodera rostochiensis TaxID=31243 RepID=A0A914I5E6_GLORO